MARWPGWGQRALRHRRWQTTRLVLFLAGVYNGSDYPFDLTWLRMLDTKLANACLDYLNFDRLGVNEVHPI